MLTYATSSEHKRTYGVGGGVGEATFPKEGVHIQNSLGTALHLPDVQVRHPEVTGIPLGFSRASAELRRPALLNLLVGFGQWLWHRSMMSMRRAAACSRNLTDSASGLWPFSSQIIEHLAKT